MAPFKEGQRVLFIGERVLFIGEHSFFSPMAIMERFKEKKIYGQIGSDVDRKKYYANDTSELVHFGNHALGTCMGHRVIRRDYLQLIDEVEYPVFDKILAEDQAEYLKEVEDFRKLCFTPSKVSFMDRTFSFPDRQMLSTNHNYACTGIWNKQTDAFEVAVRNYRPQCCAFTKTINDLDVYVPEVWLNYYGYTVYDLVEWMKFLGKCEIGFNYKYLGTGSLSATFKDAIGPPPNDKPYYESIGEGLKQNLVYPQGMEGFHRIIIEGSRERTLHTYLRFICFRYIYNHQYWTIPGHAMQIKKALGKLVTHWEALLMAHLHHTFNGYYALVGQHDLDPTRAKECTPGHFSPNFDKHIDPFQSVQTVLERLKDATGMNNSFLYIQDTFTREELNKFFTEKDYLGLYKYLTLKKAEKQKVA